MREGDFSGAAMIAQFAVGVAALPAFIVLVFATGMDVRTAFLWVLGGSVLALVVGYRHVKGLWFGFLHGAEAAQRGSDAGGDMPAAVRRDRR